MFHVPNGVAVGVMLPYAMEMNLQYEAIPAIYKKVAFALGLKIESDDDMTAARKAIERIRELIASLDLPSRLSDLGIKESDFEALADEIMEDKAIMVTPGNPNREDILGLVKAAV
jgi:alcohol dehydrogenase class IV